MKAELGDEASAEDSRRRKRRISLGDGLDHRRDCLADLDVPFGQGAGPRSSNYFNQGMEDLQNNGPNAQQ